MTEIDSCCIEHSSCKYVKDFKQSQCCFHERTYSTEEINKWCEPCQESYYESYLDYEPEDDPYWDLYNSLGNTFS